MTKLGTTTNNIYTLMKILGYFSQVQAVLLLLGGREIPPTMPTMPVSPHHNNRVLLHYLVGLQLMLFF